jgi:polysaccharide biosynthesis transport protein
MTNQGLQANRLATVDQEMAQWQQPQPYSGPQQPYAPSQQHSIREFLRVLARRKVTALQVLILVVAVGVTTTLMTTPVYQTSARMLVQGKLMSVTVSSSDSSSDPLSSLFIPTAEHDVNTQVEILRSPALQDKVYKAATIAPGTVQLDVRQVGTTDIIELTTTSKSRDAAQNFAAMLPKVYLADVKENRTGELTKALKFATERLADENKKLTAAEQTLARYKSRAGVTKLDVEQDEAIKSAAEAQSVLRQAEANAASAQARLNSLQAARRTVSAFIDTPTTTTNNQQIETLKAQLLELRRTRQNLLFTFKPTRREVKMVDFQIANLERSLAEVSKTVTTVKRTPNPAINTFDQQIAMARSDLEAAQAGLNTNRARVATILTNLRRYNPVESTQTRLLRQIAAGNAAVDMFDKYVKELTLRTKAKEAMNDPVVVLAAAGPAWQIAPTVSRNITMAILLGLVLACAAVMLQESLDDHVTDEEEARRILGTAVLGYIPLAASAPDRLLTTPNSRKHSNPQLLESFRVLRSNVAFTLVSGSDRTLLVTSTVPEEGKSTTATNLAIAIALDNRRVVLVDADLRRPKVDEIFEVSKQPGLSNVLVGQTPLHEAIQETTIPGLRVLTAGAMPPNPAELLNSPAMDELIAALKDTADTIVFDSPPCLATADAQVLSSKVDGVIYVMELGKVHKSAVLRSFELLYQAQARVLGVLFSKVDETSNRYYGYGYYRKYYGNKYDNQVFEDNGSPDSTGAVMIPINGTVNGSNGFHDTSDNSSGGNGSLNGFGRMDSGAADASGAADSSSFGTPASEGAKGASGQEELSPEPAGQGTTAKELPTGSLAPQEQHYAADAKTSGEDPLARWGLPAGFQPVRHPIADDVKEAVRPLLDTSHPVVISAATQDHAAAVIATRQYLFLTRRGATLGTPDGTGSGIEVCQVPWADVTHLALQVAPDQVDIAIHFRRGDADGIGISNGHGADRRTSPAEQPTSRKDIVEELKPFETVAGMQAFQAMQAIWRDQS